MQSKEGACKQPLEIWQNEASHTWAIKAKQKQKVEINHRNPCRWWPSRRNGGAINRKMNPRQYIVPSFPLASGVWVYDSRFTFACSDL
jgi:hypothetical protein